jgi:single-strand DNA-binding protein
VASVNKVILIGNAGRDPEMKYLQNGDAICNVTIATSETWKDKTTGEKVEKTEWHRLVFFKRLAEIAGEYIAKGKPIYVEGRLQTRKYEKEGVTHYSTEIVCDKLQLLGGKPAGDEEERPAARPAAKPAAKEKEVDQADFDDDIPF